MRYLLIFVLALLVVAMLLAVGITIAHMPVQP